jgi:L-2,4-diaminobutyrate transaminase
VRGAGLLGAIEFAADPKARRRFEVGQKVGAQLSLACLEEGVICRAMPHGDILGFAPPFVITRDDVEDVIRRVAKAVERVTSKL